VGLDAPGDGITLFKASDDDSLGHGTAAADVVLQVAPGVTIVPIRVFARRLETSPRVLVAAIDWATRHGLKLVNLSLGTSREDALAPLYVVCERARQAGVVLVAAASNRGHGWSYPAVLDPVLGVGHAQVPRAHDMVYRPEQALECGARATGQYVRGRDGRTRMVTGTSLAAPVVTGHVARLLEVHPNAGLDGVRRLLGDRAKRP
jgi:subtilisin family serine protease